MAAADIILSDRRVYAKKLLQRSIPNSEKCRIWIGGKDKDGYGIYSFYRSRQTYSIRAHRAAFIVKYGVLPIDQVHHTCEVKACINPLHLEDVSGRDNSRLSKGWTLLDGVWYCKRGHRESLYRRTYSKTTQCRLCTIERTAL